MTRVGVHVICSIFFDDVAVPFLVELIQKDAVESGELADFCHRGRAHVSWAGGLIQARQGRAQQRVGRRVAPLLLGSRLESTMRSITRSVDAQFRKLHLR